MSVKQYVKKIISSINSMTMSLELTFLLLLLPLLVNPQTIVKTLPGFPGDLPFTLETGYVGVGDLEEAQLFYYFVESERTPDFDPLFLWLTGGPGCSALSGMIYEHIGPLQFDFEISRTTPTFTLNPYSWTKSASIIFLDAPVGTGFSYATTNEGYNISDTLAVAQNYEFLRKWLLAHPKFLKNDLYIAGDSYTGLIGPNLVQEIYNGNEAGLEPRLNMKGFVLGNPVTDQRADYNARIIYAYYTSLLSEELYESVSRNCDGEYVEVNTNNSACVDDLKIVSECLSKINVAQILEPSCDTLSPKPSELLKWDRSIDLSDDFVDFLVSNPQEPVKWCRSYNYVSCYIWANDVYVQEALHIRKGTKGMWTRCNETLSYETNIVSSIEVERNLTKTPYRALVYSGDHDMGVPYIGTHAWIKSLNLPVTQDWTPWFVDGQVAGYSVVYSDVNYRLTFATVKGAGHTAPEYKPKECFAMFDRWLAHFPL